MPTVVSAATLRDVGTSRERRFRPDIQALRALAVLLVVVYHLWPGAVRGGFVGVDVFFVISGFLVTAHLMDASEREGRVPVGQFWARRAYRLLPASLLTIVVTTLGVLLWVPQNRWADQLHQAVASTFYVQNWVLADQAAGYREVSDSPSALQHFWSLAVEEQFYVVLPLVLLLVWATARRHARRVFVVVLAVATVASFVWSVIYTVTEPDQAYYVATTRAWELGVGALLGLVGSQRLRRTPPVVAWLGLAAILGAAALFTGALPFPGYAAALPVVGALLVLATTRHDRTFAAIAGSWPVQRVGDASYSIYLWHWPLVVLVPEALGRPTTTVERVGLLIASLLIGWVSLRLVEQPWRARPSRRLRWRDPAVTLIALLSAVSVMIAVTGLGVLRDDRRESRAEAAALRVDARCFGGASLSEQCGTPDVVVPALSLLSEDRSLDPDCLVGPGSARLDVCSFRPRGDETFRLAAVGDSHLGSFSPVFQELADRYGWRVDLMSKASCYPRDDLIAGMGRDAGPCRRWGAAAQSAIQQGDYDAVVTTHSEQRWPEAVDTPQALETTVQAMTRSWDAFEQAGVRVIALEDFPHFDFSTFACAETDDAARANRCRVGREAAFAGTRSQATAARRTPGAREVDTADAFCRATTCPMVIGGVRVYRDRIHPTRTYMSSVAPMLATRLRDAAVADR